MELRGCGAIVTGGTGGLGRRICLALARQGVRVAVVCEHSIQAATEYAAELSALGPRCIAVQADVTQPEPIQHMVDTAQREFGRLDILVNNAAFNQYVPYKDLDGLTLELWDKVMGSNVTGPFLCTKAAASVMKAGGQGRIVNISSGAAFYPAGSSLAYAVSKAALNHLTRCMAVALAPEIIVNCVAPGLMEGTRMTANVPPERRTPLSRMALGRPTDKDDVAAQVVEFCRTDSITGQTIVVDAGVYFH
jgi:3-oxoacyl-[acyl-carrier protein] reductase